MITTNQHRTTNTGRLNMGANKEANEENRWDKIINNQITRNEEPRQRQEHKTPHVLHYDSQLGDALGVRMGWS